MGIPTNTVEVGECGLRCSIRTQLGGNYRLMNPLVGIRGHSTSGSSSGLVRDLRSFVGSDDQ